MRFAPARSLHGLAGAARGLAGERLAERWLRRRGLRLVARRLRVPGGELDLVLAAGDELVVVEVKTGRAGPRFRPGQRVRRPDLARRARLAAGLARRLRYRRARVDVVEVVVLAPPRPPFVRVLHHPDAARRAAGGRAPWEQALP